MKKYILIVALLILSRTAFAVSNVLVESVNLIGTKVNVKGAVVLDFYDDTKVNNDAGLGLDKVYLILTDGGLNAQSLLLGSGSDGDYETIGEWLRNLVNPGHRVRTFDLTIDNPWGGSIDLWLGSTSGDVGKVQHLKLVSYNEFSGANCNWGVRGDLTFTFDDVSRELDYLGAESKRAATYNLSCSAQGNFTIKALPEVIDVSDNLEARITFDGQTELALRPFNGTRPVMVETTLTRKSMTGEQYGDFEAWAVIVAELD